MPTVERKSRFLTYRNSRYYRSDLGGFNDSIAPTTGAWLIPSRRVTNRNPNYKVYIAKGLDATTPYTQEVLNGRAMVVSGSASWAPRTVSLSMPWVTASASGVIQPFEDLSTHIMSGDDSALRDIALARLKRKLSNKTKAMNVVVPIVELRELRGLIRGAAELSTGLLNALISIKRTRGRSAYKYASKAWLTYSFGMKPMVRDTKSLVEAVGEYLTAQDQSIRLSASASKQWTSGVSRKNQGGLYGASLDYGATLVHELSYKYIAGFNLALRSGNNYGLDDQFGLGLDSLPSTMWELMPYSWLIDYFTTVGPFLEDTFASNNTSTNYVVLDRRYTMKGQLLGGLKPFASQNVQSFCTPGEIDYFSLRRSSLGTSLPTSQLRFRTVDDKGIASLNKMLNLLALFMQET